MSNELAGAVGTIPLIPVDAARQAALRLVRAGLRLEPNTTPQAIAIDMAAALGLIATVPANPKDRHEAKGASSR